MCNELFIACLSLFFLLVIYFALVPHLPDLVYDHVTKSLAFFNVLLNLFPSLRLPCVSCYTALFLKLSNHAALFLLDLCWCTGRSSADMLPHCPSSGFCDQEVGRIASNANQSKSVDIELSRWKQGKHWASYHRDQCGIMDCFSVLLSLRGRGLRLRL